MFSIHNNAEGARVDRISQAKVLGSDETLEMDREIGISPQLNCGKERSLLFLFPGDRENWRDDRMELKTPLYEAHVGAGGKMVPFAGYLLPVQYQTGVIKEHMAVRQSGRPFSTCPTWGRSFCEGPDALANLQRLLTNSFVNLTDGQARYSPMCNEKGGTVDDLIVYKRFDDHYLIVVNAANKDEDYQWMREHQSGNVDFPGCV